MRLAVISMSIQRTYVHNLSNWSQSTLGLEHGFFISIQSVPVQAEQYVAAMIKMRPEAISNLKNYFTSNSTRCCGRQWSKGVLFCRVAAL